MLSRLSPDTSGRAPDRAAWRDLLRDHFVGLDVDELDEDAGGAVDSRMVGHLQMSTVSSVDQEVRRSPALIRRDAGSYLQIGLLRSGRALVEQDGRVADLGPGDFVLYETSRPFEWRFRTQRRSRWELAVFTWPRTSFALSESRSRDLTALAFTGGHGMPRVVGDLLTGLLAECPRLGPGRATALADRIGDLVATAVDTVPSPTRASDDKRMPFVDRFIDEHLADPDLDPETIATAAAISTRQLHRLFVGREMTVAQTVRARRLEGARREIAANLSRDRSIREIARNWGYLDLAVFGRAFRAAYDVSPRQYRAQLCAESSDPKAWVRPRR